MLPFETYPGGGRELLGRVKGGNCRRGYGLEFMRRTGETRCAYCGVDFSNHYQTWLTMVLDHVVPASVCSSMGIPEEWCEDLSNRVVACAACNGFKNRYKPAVDVPQPMTLEVFYELRDRVYLERKKLIAGSHEAERGFFDTRPWESKRRLA